MMLSVVLSLVPEAFCPLVEDADWDVKPGGGPKGSGGFWSLVNLPGGGGLGSGGFLYGAGEVEDDTDSSLSSMSLSSSASPNSKSRSC